MLQCRKSLSFDVKLSFYDIRDYSERALGYNTVSPCYSCLDAAVSRLLRYPDLNLDLLSRYQSNSLKFGLIYLFSIDFKAYSYIKA